MNAVISFLERLKSFAIGVRNAIKSAAQSAFGVQQEAARRCSRWRRVCPRRSGLRRRHRHLGLDPGLAFPRRVRHPGRRRAQVRTALLDAPNRLRLDPGAFAHIAEGGLVRSLRVMMPPPLHFAEGGLVPASAQASSLGPINLTIGAETFAGLLAPEDVAQRLLQVAVSQQIRGAGRKPGYYGR